MDSRTSRLNPLGTSFTEKHWELSDPGSDTSELFQSRQRTPVRSTPEIRRNNFAGRKGKNAPPIVGLSPEKLDAKCVESTARLEDVPKIDLNSSRCQVDPFYEHGEDDIVWNPSCVTIFGFAENMVMHILRHFSNIGRITRYQIPKEGTNWIFVQFENHLQAKRAREKHGDIISGCMVGVTKCFDEEFNNASNQVACNDTFIMASKSFAGSSGDTLNSSTSSRFSGMRNCSVLSPYNQRKRVLDPPFNHGEEGVPTKSAGVFQRALGYIFNW
ncbi:Oidioi.mRNA.OKI2018_I69.chr1.g2668.t1.cds [Oikopleura dioica]|uniref:Nucleoporin NUP35 n=1 Tax=Oikopleura dioica TaxID=34765 RepID=A0ABN7STJ1_OIKDI|nr:Oidioi.mRNA.OKI2018_I69.chr1.g2668.t1.cds [Oikopleura dioica]